MLERLVSALRSRFCLGVILVADALYKSLTVVFPDIHGHGFNSDEAVVGLMGLRTVEHGEFPLFFYGQTFGGGLEYLATTVTFLALPPSITALRLATLPLRLGTDLLFYGILRLIFADRLQRHVSLLLFITMSSFFHGYLGRFSGVHLNNLLLGLATVYLFCSGRRLLDRPVWKGLVIGVGVWVSNVIFVFLVPAVVVGVARQVWARAAPRVSDVSAGVAFAVALAVGCSPRLYYLGHQTAWFVGYQGGGYTLADPQWIRARLRALLPETLPAYFHGGLAGDGIPWLIHLGIALIALACLYATVLAVAGFLKRSPSGAVLFCLMGIFWATLAALVTNRQVYNEGLRYTLALQPFAAVAIALLLNPAAAWAGERGSMPHAPPPGAFPAIRTTATLGSALLLATLGVWGSFIAEARVPEARRLAHEEIIRLLDEQGVRRGYADYWASYDIAFRTRERITLVPLYTNRIAAYGASAHDAEPKAYVFRVSAPEDSDHYRKVLQLNASAFQRLSRTWQRTGTRVTSHAVGPYMVFIEAPAGARP